MTLEQKLHLVDVLCYTDSTGVVSRLDAPARRYAEQLVREEPRLTIPDLLPRLAVDEPSAIPTI